MNHCLALCILLSASLFVECSKKEETKEPDKEPLTFKLAQLELEKEEAQKYVPHRFNHLHDRSYMKRINLLFERKSRELSTDINFVEFTKAIAWTETKWRHYVKGENEFFVIMGDDRRSFGMMQIYSVYHGSYLALEENVSYGVSYAHGKFKTALKTNCPEGSNRGTELAKVVRRAYAGYNGGGDAICRDQDPRDDHIEQFFTQKPWYRYF